MTDKVVLAPNGQSSDKQFFEMNLLRNRVLFRAKRGR